MSTAQSTAQTEAAQTETAQRIVAAYQRRRAALGDDTTAYRLVHADGDGLPDLRIERVGPYALVKYRAERWAEPAAVEAIVAGLKACGIAGATFVFDAPAKAKTPAHEARNASITEALEAEGFRPPEGNITATENGRAYALSARDGYSAGLFFDMRECRRTLAERWTERSVLNLFAYTCGFGVALAEHNEVVNVDTSRRYLDWGRENYALNGLPTPSAAFVCKDAFGYLEVAAKVGNRFDAIVLDPPSFSTGKKRKARRFSLRADFEPLVQAALAALTPDGELFVSTNWEGLTEPEFTRKVGALARADGRRIVQSWGPAIDFPTPAGPYHLKTALVGR